MYKTIVSVFILLSLCELSISQSKNKIETITLHKASYKFIVNSKVKYEIGLVSCDTCAPITNVGYRVIVKLSDKEEKIARKINKATWLNLLNNPKSDWAANLILYDIKNKDAILIAKYTRKEWLKYMKKKDIQFWKDNL